MKEQRMGIFVCSCGELNDTGDLSPLCSDDDVSLRKYSYLCCSEGLNQFEGEVAEGEFDNLVIAACLDSNKEVFWNRRMRRANHDPVYSATIPIRGCERDQIIDAVNRARLRLQYFSPHERESFPADARVIIFGNGIPAGLTALKLAEGAEQVILVSEKETLDYVPSQALKWQQEVLPLHHNLSKEQFDIFNLDDQISKKSNITTYMSHRVIDFEGQVGAFTARIISTEKQKNVRPTRIDAGAVVVAADLKRESDEIYKQHRMVLSEDAFWQKLSGFAENWSKNSRVPTVAFGCNADENMSAADFARITAAATAVKRTLAAEVYVFCSDARVAGPGLDALYRGGRKRGINFIRSRDMTLNIDDSNEKKPLLLEVEGSEIGRDVAVGESVERLVLRCDALVLTNPGGLPEKMKRICRLLKLRLNPAGYVGDENVNFEPVLTNRPGIFAVGHSRRPALLTQIFDDAVNSAMQVEEILSDQLITPTQFVGSVDSEKCALCLTCVRSCPHEAVEISQEDSAAEISLRACQGCGICASECPGGAVKLEGYSDEQLLAEMGVLKKPPEVGE